MKFLNLLQTSIFIRTFLFFQISFTGIHGEGLQKENLRPPGSLEKSGSDKVFDCQVDEKGTDFIRFRKEGQSARLETAIVSYSRNDRAQVHLIGAIHIADREYYHNLNRIFLKYDVLLFEMVGSDNWKEIKKSGNNLNNSVTTIQVVLKEFLGLYLQTDLIDYGAKNFVHADMNLVTFLNKQKEYGKSFLALVFQNSQRYNEEFRKRNIKPLSFGLEEIFKLIFSYDSSRELKLMLAPYLDSVIDVISDVEMKMGKKSVLIDLRNQIAINVLKKALQNGKTNIAIFYGAAHLPDLEKKLCQQLGFQKTDIKWLRAWDISN